MRIIKRAVLLLLIYSLLFSSLLVSCGKESGDHAHIDGDDNGYCDSCREYLIVVIDFYAINDLHGKFADTESNCGVDELSTYFESMRKSDDNVVLLSSGDMWQGSAESNLTKGLIITEWMNSLDFDSMTLGNHEYDWGEEYIEENAKLAEFPFLAINVFDKETNERAEYCDASVVIEREGLKIGIIGAIGDCYSSISADRSEGIYFKTGNELTRLVKDEASRLRAEGVDYIVYSLHDGYGQNVNYKKSVSGNTLSSYYDPSLSRGYVDLVFEGHSHKRYVLTDGSGIYHLQNGGENSGISHVEVRINSVTGSQEIKEAEFVSSVIYEKQADHRIVSDLLNKYSDAVAKANEILGKNDRERSSDEIKKLVSKLYYEYGIEKWGDKYDIVLGGGYISTRSPYDLMKGEISYSHLMSILPFDNHLVLCKIEGRDLKDKFFETDNKNYYISYGEYGEGVKKNIDPNRVYYIVVDSYSSLYAPNRLTEVEREEEEIFARDLVAEYIKNGNMTK